MERFRNFSIKKKPKNSQPYIVVSDFENVTEKECIKLDRLNNENYNNLISKAKQAQYTIRNSGLSMNLEVPIPPRPCNRDRLILWKKRNISKSVISQSNAVIFLNENGYILNEHYEAYQAIDLANELKRKRGIKTNYKDISKDFNDIYTKKDKNIFRRRSMYNVENIKRNNDIDNYDLKNEINEDKLLFNAENGSMKLRNPSRRKNIQQINFEEIDIRSNNRENFDMVLNNLSLPSINTPMNSPPSAPPINENEKYLNKEESTNMCSNDIAKSVNIDLDTPSLDNIDFNKRSSLYPSL